MFIVTYKIQGDKRGFHYEVETKSEAVISANRLIETGAFENVKVFECSEVNSHETVILCYRNNTVIAALKFMPNENPSFWYKQAQYNKDYDKVILTTADKCDLKFDEFGVFIKR